MSKILVGQDQKTAFKAGEETSLQNRWSTNYTI